MTRPPASDGYDDGSACSAANDAASESFETGRDAFSFAIDRRTNWTAVSDAATIATIPSLAFAAGVVTAFAAIEAAVRAAFAEDDDPQRAYGTAWFAAFAAARSAEGDWAKYLDAGIASYAEARDAARDEQTEDAQRGSVGAQD